MQQMVPFFLLVLLCITRASHNTGPTACGAFADPVCTNANLCYCVCQLGYVAFPGGVRGGYQEHACGWREEQTCGSSCFYWYNPGGPCSADWYDCPWHCELEGRPALCSGRGFPKTYVNGHMLQLEGWGDGKIVDRSTWREQCICDPGYFGSFDTGPNPLHFCGGPSETCECARQVRRCTLSIRTVYCEGVGRDISGPEAGEGTCTFQGISQGGGLPWGPTCGNVYESSVQSLSSTGLICLCDHNRIRGGDPGGAHQCSEFVNVLTCNNHGVDALATSRYSSQTNPASIDCACDVGYGPQGHADGMNQCKFFEACQKFKCGASEQRGVCTTAGPGCNGDPVNNPQGTCCSCNTTAGYGGLGCCPIQFGTGFPCNGRGTCASTGVCQCDPGGQQPGCCFDCDLSQTCRIDGRCDCPVIAGDSCGVYGTCVAVAGNLLNCTCNGTASVDADGPDGPLTAQPLTYGGRFCCPIINGVVCGGGGAFCTSTPHPSDPMTGGCNCGPSFDSGGKTYNRVGRFCCPIFAGQTKECGALGVCQTSGFCSCPAGVTGLACELNTNCDPNRATVECNGAGTCILNSGGTFGLGSYLEDLRFDDVLNTVYTTQDGVNITDDGAVQFLRAMYRAFYGFDPINKAAESTYYLPNITACQQAGGNRGLCLWNMLSQCQPSRDAYIGTFAGNLELYAESAFHSLFPTRIVPPPAGSPNEPFMLQQTQAFVNNCIALGQPREAMASMMAWDIWLQLYRDYNSPTTFPSTSSITIAPNHLGAPYHCRCQPPAGNAQIGVDFAAGGSRCQFSCRVGGTTGDLQVCSGFSQGQFRGYCTGNDNCECSSKFSGNACQFSLTDGCFAVNSQDSAPCSNSIGSTRHGLCLRTDIPGQTTPNFNCNCSAVFEGKYCQLCRCQPPNVQAQPGECNGRGICNQVGQLFQCDCKQYLDTLYDTGNSNLIPFLATGNACEANGTSGCANFKQASGQPVGVGNWQVCSARGNCVWDYNTQTASCSCQSGYSGNRCQSTLCNPDCNVHQFCDSNFGTCGCMTFWGTPSSCAAGNRTCECMANLCDHGTPSADGSFCTCDAGWKKVVSGPTAGRCSVVQCRLVVHNDQGVRPCVEPQDQRCADLSSISQSLTQGCCVDTCPQCLFNATGNSRTCVCDALSGSTACYDSSNEMCLPKCHGNDVLHPNPPNCDSATNPITCHCEHVSLQANQFRDLRCQRYTCSNNAPRTATTCNPSLQQCCDCSQTAYSGSFCTSSICGSRGTPFPNGTACDCTPPFRKSAGHRDCDTDSCAPGTVTSDPTSMTKPFFCSCPGSTFVVSITYSLTFGCLLFTRDATLWEVRPQ